MAVSELPAPVQVQRTTGFLIVRILTIVLVANMAILVMQVAAVRQLAPLVGNSLDTWTAIIGMYLAGICLGNACGGNLADRYPSSRTLLGLLWVGALTVFATIGIALLFHQISLTTLPLYGRIGLISLAVCFPVSFVLSLITPLAIRLALPDLRSAGRIVGLVYALGTVGSLVGNFLTGFVLLAHYDLNVIIIGTGVSLLALSILAMESKKQMAKGELFAPLQGNGPITGEPTAIVSEDQLLARQHIYADDPVVSLDKNLPSERTDDTPATRSGQSTAAQKGAALGPRGWFALPGNVVLACFIVTIASFCSLAIELAAPRLLAPEIGISIYTFSAIIGVSLGAIAIGNLLGGVLADMLPRQIVLNFCLLIAGLTTLVIIAGFQYLLDYQLQLEEEGGELSMMQRGLTWIAMFLVPLILLGMISPQTIRLTLKDVQHAGRVSGRIYAFSCLGAIGGVFATGWMLISWLGVYKVIFVIGMILVALPCLLEIGLVIQIVMNGQTRLLSFRFLRHVLVLPVFAALISGSLYYFFQHYNLASRFTLETNYYSILVDDAWEDERWVKRLVLDHLVHSYVDPEDPNYLGYEHEHVQTEMTQWIAFDNPDPHVLLIGGGGYTFPRWAEAELPEVNVEVVEIDPGVTEIAHQELGLGRDTQIKTWNMDGRQFVVGLAKRGHYDLVIQDAVNDLSVPFHLMTKEYNDGIRAILNKDGIYLLTVIDKYETGQFMRAAIRTLRKTFSEVHLLDTSRSWEGDSRSVYVIYASERKLDLGKLDSALLYYSEDLPDFAAQAVGLCGSPFGFGGFPVAAANLQRRGMTVAQDPELLQQYIDDGRQIVLTDQFAPVDNLLAILYRER